MAQLTLLGSQLFCWILKLNFIRVWPWKKSWIEVTFCVHMLILGSHVLLDQSHSNPDVTWGNDCLISHYCAIFHENCAISHSLFLVQKLISRKFHFQKKWFIISLCSLLFVLCLSKSRDLTNTKYGSREITWNNGTKSALHHQSLSLSLSLSLVLSVTSFGITCLRVTCCTAPPRQCILARGAR